MRTQTFRKALALTAGAIGWLTLAGGQARAALIVSAPTINVFTGTTGTFDVLLQNTGPSVVSIGGTSFGIMTTNPGITFTLANISTVTSYIFAGNSLFGPDITISSGTSLVASDSANSPISVNVASGATVGLGHVTYVISAGAAAGTFAITFSPAATSLSTGAGANIPITTLTNGSISVTATPEPASLSLVGGLAVLAGVLFKKKQAAR